MQPKIGILMLDSKFPRINGDVGNPATWDFDVLIEVVPKATPQAVVSQGENLSGHVIAAGQRFRCGHFQLPF